MAAIQAPKNQTVTLPVEPGQLIEFGFDLGEATLERDGNNLVLVMDDGGRLVLSDFFVTGGGSLPTLKLADGTEVPSAQMLSSLDPDLDVSPAAGPGAGPGAAGSGVGEYSAEAGDLLDGVERLGMTDPFFWGGRRGQAGISRYHVGAF